MNRLFDKSGLTLLVTVNRYILIDFVHGPLDRLKIDITFMYLMKMTLTKVKDL